MQAGWEGVPGHPFSRDLVCHLHFRPYQLVLNFERSAIKYAHQNSYNMHSYRSETALQGGLVMAQNGRLELGDNTLRTL